jgi:CRP/FNR family transcriptional regulator, nitrogen oxide reductase regulator
VVFAKQVALFAGLDSDALNEVRAASRERNMEAGATFFREGEPALAFFVLETGSVKFTQLAPEGHQVVLRLIGPGDAFGGVAAFGGTTYPITAEAVTDQCARMARNRHGRPHGASSKARGECAEVRGGSPARASQMTGTTLYTVSRIISRLEADGILEAGRQRMVIRHPDGLVKIADDLD